MIRKESLKMEKVGKNVKRDFDTFCQIS